MAKLYQHRTDRTYYTKKFEGGIVTRQIHPDGVLFLKRAGVRLGGDIPSPAMSTLVAHNWLFTREEVACWGEMDWSPAWERIGETKTVQYPDWLKPHKERQQREALVLADRQAEDESRRLAEAKRAEKKAHDRARRALAKRRADDAQHLDEPRAPLHPGVIPQEAPMREPAGESGTVPLAVAPAYVPGVLFGSAVTADVTGHNRMRFPLEIGRHQEFGLPSWMVMLIVVLMVIAVIGIGQAG